MNRMISEVVVSVEKNEETDNKLLKFSARNVVTGKYESSLVILGDESELMELVERLKNRIEQAFRQS